MAELLEVLVQLGHELPHLIQLIREDPQFALGVAVTAAVLLFSGGIVAVLIRRTQRDEVVRLRLRG
jgi:hypothetical protein